MSAGMVTDSTGRTASDPQEPLAALQGAVDAARREAGSQLAALRHAAGFSQVKLAAKMGYRPTAVAHAELGRRPVSAEFWELADEALGAGGELAAQGTRIRDLARAAREERRRQVRARHA